MIRSRMVIAWVAIPLFAFLHLGASQDGQASSSSSKLQQALTWAKSWFVKQQPASQIGEYEPFGVIKTPGSLVAFHDDGQRLTSVGIQKGKVVVATTAMNPHKELIAFSKPWSPGSDLSWRRFLLSGNGSKVLMNGEIFDTLTGLKVAELSMEKWSKSKYLPLCFNHQGTQLAFTATNADHYLLLNIENNNEVYLRTRPSYWGHWHLAEFSRDGKTFAACGIDSSILLFDTETGARKKEIPLDRGSSITSLSLHKNKPYLLYSKDVTGVSSFQEVALLNLQTDENTTIIKGNDSNFLINQVGFTNTGTNLYALSSLQRVKEKKNSYQMNLWSLHGEVRPQISKIQTLQFKNVQMPEKIINKNQIAFSPTDEFFALGDDSKIQLYRNKNALIEQELKIKATPIIQQAIDKSKFGWKPKRIINPYKEPDIWAVD